MAKLKQILLPAAVLMLICVIITGLLAVTNAGTADRIAQLAKQTDIQNQQKLLPNAARFETAELLDKNGQPAAVQVAYDASGALCGYIVNTTAKGYGGQIGVMTGFTPEGAVAGVTITSSNETPGLGRKAEDAAFLNQYAGTEQLLSVVKGSPSGPNEIAAVTGATITSRAVTDAVNQARTLIELFIGAAQQ